MMRFLIFLLFSLTAFCQTTDSTEIATDSVYSDAITPASNTIYNASAVKNFLTKLKMLDSTRKGKINIVHIGDSHIQADLMTRRIRTDLQQKFGNAGRGFIFPHKLAGTNGAFDYKFTSDSRWNSYRIVSPVGAARIGLSGIALESNSKDFFIELDVKSNENGFTKIRLITPDSENSFDLAVSKKTISVERKVPRKIVHKIKNGEALSIIADKYNVSQLAIKKANGMKSDRIRAGRTLKIPTSGYDSKPVFRSEFNSFEMEKDSLGPFYLSSQPLEKIYLLPSAKATTAALNGISIENDAPGILYHGIGVNGAKFSDYNKYPRFFSELKALNPDLVVLSLGTNESFDKMETALYLEQLRDFLQQLKSENPSVEVLVLTPPPSQFRGKKQNYYVESYALGLIGEAPESGFAVYDLYAQMGGAQAVSRNASKGIIGPDRVHYSQAGYDLQGSLFAKAVLDLYEEFKKSPQ